VCTPAQLESEFEEQWANGEVPGWENKGTEKESVLQESEVDLDYYSSVEELVELGPQKLKEV
jgi:splicing factor 3A subunit 3